MSARNHNTFDNAFTAFTTDTFIPGTNQAVSTDHRLLFRQTLQVSDHAQRTWFFWRNKQLAILLDGKIVSCPWIKGPMFAGLAITFYTRGKAESVAKGLVGQGIAEQKD